MSLIKTVFYCTNKYVFWVIP